MSVPCLHYSRFFKDKLLSGEITGAVLKGKWQFPSGSDVFIYVSEADSVEEGTTDHKLGVAGIVSSTTMRVKELTEREAKAAAYNNRAELLEGVKRWHKLGESDFVTFVEFKLTPL
jgi:hypothetical protein